MEYRESFKLLEPIFKAMDASSLIRRNRKTEVVSVETLQLINTSLEDRARFAAIARFDLSLIDSLKARFEAWAHCRDALLVYQSESDRAEDEWKSFSPPAKELKKRFIRRRTILAEEENDLATLALLKKLAGGKGKENLLRDFELMNAMIAKDREKIGQIGLDNLFVTMTVNTEKTLHRIYRSVTLPDTEKQEMALLERKAYSYLAEATNIICRYGRMIFEDSERSKLYISKQLQKQSKVKKARKPRPEPVDSPE